MTHVGLNLIFLRPGETGGMETVARGLLPELLARAGAGWRLTAFVNAEAAEAGEGPWMEMEHVVVPVRAARRVEWVRGEQQLLPRLARRAGVELLHSLGGTAPVWGRFARVVTIHDVLYRVAPQAHPGLRSLGMRLLVPLAARRSTRIVAPSQTTADDLQRLLGVPAAKIDVVANGVSPPPPGVGPVAPRGRPLVLTASGKLPHKNLAALLDALALIEPSRRPELVLPGYPTAHEGELRERARRLGLEADVRFLGWLPASELEALYRRASCAVLPSVYEGFGLPVLEAMARGVPVACSRGGSLGEVAGGAALLFDPSSPEQIAACVERLLAGGEEVERLRAAGLRRAAAFGWPDAAERTLACYQRALADAGRAGTVRPGG